MPDFGFHIEGDQYTERQLQRLTLFLSDLRSFWPLVVPLVRGWWRRQFETEGDFAGDRWVPLSPEYAARKAVDAPGKGILVYSGVLKRAAADSSQTFTPTTLTMSIESDYLPFHQEGTARMPARPLVFGSPLPVAAQVELDLVAGHYVTDLLARL